MITLFRRVREKLIASGSTSKYMLYAAGEIFLVVIGILIALQVNNWNEEKKASVEERILLENLRADFKSRYDELNELQEARIEAMNMIGIMTEYVVDPALRPPDDQMHSNFGILNNLILFNDQFKVLDILFSTGKIDDISNRELKSLLLQWPQHVEEMMEEQRLRTDVFKTYFLPLQFEHLSMRNVLEQYNFRGYSVRNDVSTRKKSDFESLLTTTEFENYLSYLEILHAVNKIDSQVLIDDAARIIELLDAEISDS